MSSAPHRWMRHVNWSGIRKEISLRWKCFGGPVRTKPRENPSGNLAQARRIVLLIHGFNVNQCDAGVSFEKFTAQLPFRWQGRSAWVYWPGDATRSWKGSNRPGGSLDEIASIASYPFQANRAIDSASQFCEFLKKQRAGRKNPIHVTIVAHSLGCLLAMELVDKLTTNSSVRLELVILMAAAVPQYAFRLGERYSLRKFSDTKFVIYHSGNDEVLQGAFRPGQFAVASGPFSLFRRRGAVGLKGLAHPSKNAEQIVKQHKHSGYWPDREIAIDLAERLEGKARTVAKRFLVARTIGPLRTTEIRKLDGRSVEVAVGLRRNCTCS